MQVIDSVMLAIVTVSLPMYLQYLVQGSKYQYFAIYRMQQAALDVAALPLNATN
jgi:hypothetical protein